MKFKFQYPQSFIVMLASPTIYVQSTAAFMLQQQSWVVGKETIRPTKANVLTLWHLWLVLRTGTPCSCDPKKSSGIELWFFPVNRTLRVEVRAEGKGVGSLPFAAASLPNRSCLSSKGAVCQTTGCSTPDFCLLYIHVTFLFIMTVMWGVTETW